MLERNSSRTTVSRGIFLYCNPTNRLNAFSNQMKTRLCNRLNGCSFMIHWNKLKEGGDRV